MVEDKSFRSCLGYLKMKANMLGNRALLTEMNPGRVGPEIDGTSEEATCRHDARRVDRQSKSHIYVNHLHPHQRGVGDDCGITRLERIW